MKVDELEALLELIKAMITNENSEHVEDAVRFNSLKDDFVEKFCN